MHYGLRAGVDWWSGTWRRVAEEGQMEKWEYTITTASTYAELQDALNRLVLHSSTVVDEVATKLAVWARGAAPHAGTGARGEMGRPHLGRVVDLLVIGEVLTRHGLP